MTVAKLIEKLKKMPQDASVQSQYYRYPAHIGEPFFVSHEELYDHERELYPDGKVGFLNSED